MDYIWEAVHPVFRSAIFYYISFLAFQEIMPRSENWGVAIWFSVFGLIFFIAATYVLFWGDDRVVPLES